MDVKLTFQIIVLAVIAFMIITAWDEVFDRVVFKWFGLDREEISSWAIVGSIAIVLLLIALYAFNIEAHELLGIGEEVDVQLTGKTEYTRRGRIVHDTRYTR